MGYPAFAKWGFAAVVAAAVVVPGRAGAVGRLEAAEPPDLSTREGEDWAGFLGPSGNGRSAVPRIAAPWPKDGPRLVWHCDLGEGYCSPAVARGRAVVYDRAANECRLRCLDAETGRTLWEQRHPTDYVDMFGYDGGPRAAPVIAGDRVLTFGPEGRLECRSLADGTSLWHVDTSTAYHVVRNFFGVGAAPLVHAAAGGDLVIVQVGGSRPGSAPPAPDRLDLVRGLDSGLVAFDLATGRERWRSSDQLASYSAPIAAAIAGEPRLLAWMRDDLLVVAPQDGTVVSRFRWRSDELFSAVAASPVVHGSEVLLTEAYGPGSVLLDVSQPMPRVLRQDRPRSRPATAVKAHWSTPILHDGHLYAASGRHAGDAELVCADWRTGAIRWSEKGFGRASMVLAAGHLIVLGEYGELVLVRATPERYEEVSRVLPDAPAAAARVSPQLLPPPCWAAPVVARGLLYVRGAGRLACFDLVGGK